MQILAVTLQITLLSEFYVAHRATVLLFTTVHAFVAADAALAAETLAAHVARVRLLLGVN